LAQRLQQDCYQPRITETIMAASIIQDWTSSTVLLKFHEHREVEYRVYRDSAGIFQEIREPDGLPLHTQEIPEGMKLDRNSYEFLLRYVLLDVIAN
jgi:hypothetical protein